MSSISNVITLVFLNTPERLIRKWVHLKMEIKLLVLRTSHVKDLQDFYNLLGFHFEYHKHGNSPLHYSALIDTMILEIYPLAKNQEEVDKNLRIGFSLDNFDDTIRTLKESNIPFSSEPVQTDYGYMAVVSDPDGRKVELYKK